MAYEIANYVRVVALEDTSITVKSLLAKLTGEAQLKRVIFLKDLSLLPFRKTICSGLLHCPRAGYRLRGHCHRCCGAGAGSGLTSRR